MAENTGISWADHTYNGWIGCSKVSPACKNCYAELFGKRFGVEWGPGKPRRRTKTARDVRKWDRAQEALVNFAAAKCSGCGYYTTDRAALTGCKGYCQDPSGKSCDALACKSCGRLHYWTGSFSKPPRPKVFVSSLSDWLDSEVPVEWLADLLALVAECRNLLFLMLTKRPELWERRLLAVRDYYRTLDDKRSEDAYAWLTRWLEDQVPPSNVWIGTTVEDQKRADERIPCLRRIPAKVRFLSCEPLLGPLDLHTNDLLGLSSPDGISWILCGGESGPGARPTHPGWIRSLRDQTKAAAIPFHFKQHGAWIPGGEMGATITHIDIEGEFDCGGVRMVRLGKKNTGRILDGVEWDEFPDDK